MAGMRITHTVVRSFSEVRDAHSKVDLVGVEMGDGEKKTSYLFVSNWLAITVNTHLYELQGWVMDNGRRGETGSACFRVRGSFEGAFERLQAVL